MVKYGGSVLEDGSAIRRAAEAVKEEYEKGVKVVVVVSALKGVTDQLLRAAEDIAPSTPQDVVDHIIGLGEEQSVRLMASSLKSIGIDSAEVTPHSPSWPIVTDETHGDATPILDECESGTELGVRPLIERGIVPVVCGFVGRSFDGKITTLGRGGSDTTAVILARCLDADELVLVKDVGGIYSADPKKVEGAKPIEALSAWEAHILATNGAKVLHSKIFKYKPSDLRIRIVSRDQAIEGGGTTVNGVVPDLLVKAHGRPVTKVNVICSASLMPEALIQILKKVREAEGEILYIKGEDQSITMCLEGTHEVIRAMHTLVGETDYVKAITGTNKRALITVKGMLLGDPEGEITKIFDILTSQGIEIHDINTGPSSVSILVDWDNRSDALESLKCSLKEELN